LTKELTHEDRHHLEEIRKKLSVIGFKEANFLKIELLFYEAMEIARGYGNDVQENKLLNALKLLQANQYQDTKSIFKKSTQRELVIRRFITGFKAVLSSAVKNMFFIPHPTSP
jgi:hypothetical protein